MKNNDNIICEKLQLPTTNDSKLTLSNYSPINDEKKSANIKMISFKTPVNRNRLNAFMKLDPEFYLPLFCYAETKCKINSYRYYVRHFNFNDIEYNLKNNRLYSKGLSIQGFPVAFRNFLLSNCYDYDMNNCFPTILLKLTQDLNLQSKYLKKYVDDRNNFLKKNKIEKIEILKLINIDKPELSNFTPTVNNLICEIMFNKQQIIDKHIDKVNEKEDSLNPISSKIYSILAFHENMLLCRILNKYKSELTINGCVPMYDGFATPFKINIETLNNLTSDFNITWKTKNMDSPLFYIPDLSSENSIADLFIECFETNLIKTMVSDKDSEVYVYDNNIWKYNDKKNTIIKNLMKNDFSNYIHNYFSKLTSDYFNKFREQKDIDNEYKLLLEEYTNCIRLLSKYKSICDISNCIITYIPSKKIDFDDKPDYLPFDNCILDLKTGQPIPHQKDYYITQTIGYDYSDANKDIQNEIIEMIKQIFPQEDERNLILYKLAHTLNGYNHPRFTILQGEGGNGKSVLLNLLNATLNKFSYNLGNSICVSGSKGTGAKTEIAKTDRKRFLWCSEPAEGDKFNFSLIKQLTGDREINAREIFSKKTETLCCGDLWIACNDDIPLDITSDGEAVRRRIIEMQMRSSFLTNPDPNIENSYKANPMFLEKSTYEKFKMDFIHLLTPYSIELFKNNRNIDKFIPNNITELGLKYITKSNPFKSWFNTKFEKTNCIDDIVSIKDIFDSYKSSDDYLNLTKKEKRINNYQYFVEKLKRDPDTKLYYLEKLNDTKNQTTRRNIIRSFKQIIEASDNNSQDKQEFIKDEDEDEDELNKIIIN